MKQQITAYTDGACSGNPGPGGWAVVLLYQGHSKELSGFAPQTTNNRMELMATIVALESITRSVPITIYTDSTYVKNGIEKWVAQWKTKGWKTSAKQPVKNQDLWIRLDTLCTRYQPKWQWVRGHSGNKYNEQADNLARAQIAKHR